jgi:hypothetical protein
VHDAHVRPRGPARRPACASATASRFASISSIPSVALNWSRNTSVFAAHDSSSSRRRAASGSLHAARNASTRSGAAASASSETEAREHGELVAPALHVRVARLRVGELVAQAQARAVGVRLERDRDRESDPAPASRPYAYVNTMRRGGSISTTSPVATTAFG